MSNPVFGGCKHQRQSPVIHLHAIGNILLYNSIVYRSTVGGKPSWWVPLQPYIKIHYFLEIGHENRYMPICHVLLIQEGFLSVSSESMCKKDCLYPYSTQGLNPTNPHELTNIWIRGWNVLSSWISWLNHTVSSQFLQFVGLLGVRLKFWPQIPQFQKSCLICNKFLMHSWTS